MEPRSSKVPLINNCGQNRIDFEAGERLATVIEVELIPTGEEV